MKKAELVKTITELLRDNNARKPVHIPKRVFTISDNDGAEHSFSVKSADKAVLYTVDDVKTILDAFIEVVQNNVKHGESTNIYGLGCFDVYLRAGRMTKSIQDGSLCDIKARYIPRFVIGTELKKQAMVFDMSERERGRHPAYPKNDESMMDCEEDYLG